MRLIERRFTARVPLPSAWDYLARVERWPSWARHIRAVELAPPGALTPLSRGTIRLANGIRSTFVMTALEPGVRWSWSGPFLWLRVDYDHRFTALAGGQTEIAFLIDAEGFGVSVLGPLFALVYRRQLERALPRLVRELEALGGRE